MKKYVIWGTGKMAEVNMERIEKFEVNKDVNIIGFIDSDRSKWGQFFHGIQIYEPKEIHKIEFDYVDIWLIYEKEKIRERIINEYNIPDVIIRDVFTDFKEFVHEKIKMNTDTEIREFADIFINSPNLEVYAYRPQKIDEIRAALYDSEKSLYYVIFEGKRLYLSRKKTKFLTINGKKYVGKLWQEQDLNSPHLYEEREVTVNAGDVLVDAGACEGNFSLHNIDKVSRVYLIECDPDWMEALKATFEPYKEKVVFCDKFLSDTDTDTTITLDTLVQGRVDFVKMDIEGEEIRALNGANRVLSENKHMKCSICAYHRHGDEVGIKQILNDKGFITTTSKGYMLFIYDDDIWRNPELRRGIVRGYK